MTTDQTATLHRQGHTCEMSGGKPLCTFRASPNGEWVHITDLRNFIGKNTNPAPSPVSEGEDPEHSCGGPKEACLRIGCKECGTTEEKLRQIIERQAAKIDEMEAALSAALQAQAVDAADQPPTLVDGLRKAFENARDALHIVKPYINHMPSCGRHVGAGCSCGLTATLECVSGVIAPPSLSPKPPAQANGGES